MEAKEWCQLENRIGRLFHCFYENNVPGIMELFARDAVLQLPDQRRTLQGWKDIEGFWIGKAAKRKIDEGMIPEIYLPCDIYLKPMENMFYGEWDTYSFRSEAFGEVQYFLTHMQCVFIREQSGEWLIQRLRWNEILELCPWKLQVGHMESHASDHRNKARKDEWDKAWRETPSAEDYMEIRNLQGRFTQDGTDRSWKDFAADKDTILDLPTLYDAPALGVEAVKRRLEDLRAKEIFNRKNYVFMPVICAPVIRTRGNNGWGQWLVWGIEVKKRPEGPNGAPWEISMNLGRFVQEFVKADGKWRFLKFRHCAKYKISSFPYDPEKGLRHRMREKALWDNTWLPGPKAGDLCLADAFDIEMILPQWTGRLRGGNSMDFVDHFMVNSKKEISMLVAGSTQKRIWGHEEIRNRFGRPPEKDHKENPVFHTLASPVIEFFRDGTLAEAAWTDVAIADFSGAFQFPKDPARYYMTLNKYYHRFVKDQGIWKLYDFRWEPGTYLGNFKFEAQKCRGFYKGWDHQKGKLPVLGEAYEYPGYDSFF